MTIRTIDAPPRPARAAGCIAILLAASFAGAQAQSPAVGAPVRGAGNAGEGRAVRHVSTATATMTFVVAIVGADLSVKPVPLYELRLVPDSSQGGEPISLRTALDGTITVPVPLGAYTITSVAPVSVDGKQYSWSVPLLASAPTRVELTNANATLSESSIQPVRARQMAPEMEVYQVVRSGVFRIESGLSQGSGFLVDASGLILTNAHVVAGQTIAAAALDSAHRIPLQIVYRDNDADVAVLRADAGAIAGRSVLPLASGDSGVEPGERVFAIGYPLNQEQTLTSGIVSSVREGAIISDVNINHGNSGGPMLNLAGEVVAINTFGDFTQEGGPGISGAIRISRAMVPLARARTLAATLPAPDSTPLPMIPSAGFRTMDLKAFADTVKSYQYYALDSIGVGSFYVSITTSPAFYVRAKRFEDAVAKDRKKREARAGIDDEARFSEMRDFRDWSIYVGDQRAPVVALTIEPKVGETGGSLLRRMLLTGVNGKETLRYSGDLERALIFRNGDPVTPLRGGTTPVKQYINNSWVDLKDVANYGYYVLPATAFAPDDAGAPPSIIVYLADMKNPVFPSCHELSREVTARIWNDFQMYYGGRNEAFRIADPKQKGLAPRKGDVCRAAAASLAAETADSTRK